MRKQRKRVVSILLTALMVVSCLSGCASSFVPIQSDVAHAASNGMVTVTLDEAEHGSIYFMDSEDSSMQVEAGTNVTIVASPDGGYQTSQFLVTDEYGNVTELADAGNTVSFTADKSCTVSVTFEPVNETINGGSLELEIEEADSPVVSVEEYILSNADQSYVGTGKELKPMDVMTVTHTYVDGDMLPNATLDLLWGIDADGDGMSDNKDALLNQSLSNILLYEVSADSDYYVGKAAGDMTNARVTDWVASMNDTGGNVLDDVIYDDSTNLVYVPKHYQMDSVETDGTYTFLSTSIQLLYTVDDKEEASMQVDVDINSEKVDGDIAVSGIGSTSYLNVVTEFVLAIDDEAKKDIKSNTIDSVVVNGIDYEPDSRMWDYDSETGKLTIYMTPAVVDSVEVNMSNGFIKDVKNFFARSNSDSIVASAATPGANDVGGEWYFSSEPIVGMSFVVNANMLYGNEYATHGTIPAGYLQGDWEFSADDLVRRIIMNEGLDPSQMSIYGFNKTWGGSILAGTYGTSDCAVEIDGMEIILGCSHGAKVSQDYEYSTKGISNGSATGASNAYVTIMAVQDGWIYFGVVTPTVQSQSGYGIFKTRYRVYVVPDPETPPGPETPPPPPVLDDTGIVKVTKHSAHPEYTDGNSAYSYNGATYGVYDSAGVHRATLTVGADGTSGWSPKLPSGDYSIREIASSTGYMTNPNSKSFHIYAGTEQNIDMADTCAEDPLTDPIGIVVQKKIGGRPTGESIGDIPTLSGIKFRVDYYNNVYTSGAAAVASGTPNASAVFETDENGLLWFFNANPVDGTTWPYQSLAGFNTMPLGTIVITEISALDGLFVRPVGSGAHTFTITDDGNRRPKITVLESWPEPEDNTVPDTVGVYTNPLDLVYHGGVTVWKADAAWNQSSPQGDGTLEGITYTITNKSINPVIVNGVTYDVDEVVMTISTVNTGNGYIATSGAKVLPYGTYLIEEVSANASYHNAMWKQTFEIRTDGQMVTYDSSNNWNRNAVKRGGIEVTKADWDTGRSEPQGDATLAGVKYDIYNRSLSFVYVNGKWYPPGGHVMTITTELRDLEDANGNTYSAYVAKTGPRDLPYGTYEVIEVWPSTGYHISQYRQTVSIRDEGDIKRLKDASSNYNKDQVQRGGVTVIKADADWHTSRPQGDATLSDVRYTITNRSEHNVFLRSTGKEYAPGEVVMTIETTWNDTLECYIATSGASVLPYGTYEITEVDVSTGYNNAQWTKTFSIRREGQMVEYNSEINGWNENPVKRGGVIVGKIDRETGQYISLGDAHLDGNVFEVINRSAQAVYVNGKTYAPGEVVMNITTEETEWNGRTIYAATTENYVLPYGTYEVREVASGTGYLYNSASRAWSKTFEIREHGQMIDLTAEEDAVENQVLREDWHFKKKAEDSMERMESVAFLITSMTTGERHVIVTDENGLWGSSAIDNESSSRPHTQRTNSNDPTSPISNGALAVDENGNWYVADSSKLDCDAGIWFTGMPEDMTTWSSDGMSYTLPTTDGPMTGLVRVDDTLRAFPYDTYKVEELPCDANKDYKLVSFTVTLHRYTADHDGPGLDMDYGTIDDKRIFVDTMLKFDYIDKVIPNGPDVTITDTVVYGGLEPSNYVIKGELHLLNEDGTDGGVVATREMSFAVGSEIGSIEVPFTLDTTSLGGRKLVAFEYLYKDGALYGQHAEIDDPDQTVTVLEIHTMLTGDLEHTSRSDAATISLKDTITYNGLEPGKLYTIEGTLMDKATGKVVTDGNGYPVVTEERFVPYKPAGTVDIVFTFSGVDMSDRTVVAFETISRHGLEYAVHADLEDADQTVYFPGVDTTAADKADSTKDLTEAPGQSLTDAITMSNLLDGYSYKMIGELHVRDAEGNDEGVLTDADGNAYTAEITWEGNKADQIMTFSNIDASGLGGKDIVIYQNLYGKKDDGEWVLLYTHDDVLNEKQSLYVPHIETVLLTDQGIHEIQVPADGNVTLVDTITYENLIPGQEYTAIGTLHLQGVSEDGNITDEGAVVDASGKTVFTPDEKNGTVEVTFTFNASELAGRNVTAFESLYSSTNKLVASHEDITDEGQTVHFAEIETTMTSENNLHMLQITGDGMVTLTDVVKYTNLIPGNEYTVTGTPHIQVVGEDGSITDGGAVTDADGNEIVKTHTFVPSEPDGEVTIVFMFDASELVGRTTVAFETISTDGVEFAVHADITDEAQSVHFVEIGTTAVTENKLHIMQLTDGKDTVTVKDTVEYKNLIPGLEYVMTGTLHYQNRNADGSVYDGGTVKGANGNDIVGTVTFTPETANGSVEMVFNIETNGLNGKTVVAFEALSIDGTTIATHEDITDEEQAVHFVDIRTTFLTEDGTHLMQIVGDKNQVETITLIDTVFFTNLIPGQEYTIDGTLHLRGTDEDGSIIDAGTVKDIDGNDVTGTIASQARAMEAEDTEDTEDTEEVDNADMIPEEMPMSYYPTGVTTFVPTKADGSIDILFTFDASELKDKTTVAFESLKFEGTTIAAHEDITDEEQSVHFVDMGTTAHTDDMLHVTQAWNDGIKGVKITDVVTYSNLIPGRPYTVTGTLHLQDKDLAGNIIDGGTVKDKDGNDLTRSVIFTPERPDGNIEVVFDFDSFDFDIASLAGKTTVTFESMSVDGIEFAVHNDITDEAQSIHFVKIGTTALTEDKNHVDGKSHEVRMRDKEERTVTITDTVTYENIIPGLEYTMIGTLHIQSEDKDGNIIDGGVFKDKDGKAFTTELTFKPEKPDGSVEMTFNVKTADIPEGGTLVAFETLSCRKSVIASHEDITDEEQSVTFIPPVRIKTTALTENKTHFMQIPNKESKTVTVIDTVSYENVIPGAEYVLSGTLHIQTKDRNGNIVDGGVLKDAKGERVTSEVTFKPEKDNGSVEVKFVFDTSSIPDGGTLVVFETLSYDGAVVASHEDITDKEQAVTFTPDKVVKIGTTAHMNDNTHEVQLPIKGSKTVTITDTVTYEDVVPGREYTLVGTLHIQTKDSKGNIVDGGKLEDKDGKVITSKVTFKPEKSSGSIDVQFEVSTFVIPNNGFTLVAFETMSCGDIVVASHEDITDKAQSITFKPSAEVKISTTALVNNSHTVQLPEKGSKTVTITDTVNYENMTVGAEYTLTGTLHIQSKDKDGNIIDGGKLEDANGKMITSTVRFKPTKTNGSVKVTFKVDTSRIANGGTLVVFETLSSNGSVVAAHEDIKDSGQSVTFVSPNSPTPTTKPDKPNDIVKTGQNLFLLTGIIGLTIMTGGGYFFFTKTPKGRKALKKLRELFSKK